MSFHAFDLERWQSTWENRVRYNLSESGVHPLAISELLTMAGTDPEEFLALRMVYSQSDGTERLRTAVADLYDGTSNDQIVVTVGSSEANFVACWTLIEPGDRVTVLTPTYLQTWGIARNFGAHVTSLPLHRELGWEPNLDDLTRTIPAKTKLVVVTNPNNPTGHVLSAEARRGILERASAVGAWVLADEVYQGAELDGVTTSSLWGGYDRLIIVNGLSKAYALPGLRIGWIVGPRTFRDAVVQRHDYTVIGPSPASDYLAVRALTVREAILQRTRTILLNNYPTLERWLGQFGELFDWRPPQAGAICFVRYRHPMAALQLVESIRAEENILLVPGEHFDRPHHLRLGFGNEPAELDAALALLDRGIRRLLLD